ncbi:heme ABC exporter ATP-binding protein CcmA [Aurantimonas endophytica]|uniref:heme ABC exporter ATP-binding protein CcmA n=1 Tax=Aurantimonas endophytica TaxID=1522175 RepID=UPI003AB9305B
MPAPPWRGDARADDQGGEARHDGAAAGGKDRNDRRRRVSGLAITISGLTIGRGSTTVAGPLELALGGGEALIVTGPNGAGKSTLLRTLAGLLRPLAGRITVAGVMAPDGEPARSLPEIAHYVGHRNAMKPSVSVGDNLRFWARFLGGPGLSVDDSLEAVGLPGLAHLPFAYLSAGQQRRASLARLLIAHRPVWILDEPTAALDTASQARFAGLMADHLASGGSVIAATHQPLGLVAPRELAMAPAPAEQAAKQGGAIADADLAAAEGWL